MGWLSQLFRRNRRYEDISASIDEHIAERADELEEQGMSRTQAEQAARREFGNAALIAQQSREVWQWPGVESILADLRLALRRLRRSPGFAATVLLTLAIGIGANCAVFTVIDRVLIEPLPYPDSSQIVALRLHAPGAGGLLKLGISPSMYLTFADHNRTFQSLGIWTPRTANVTGLAQPEQAQMEVISSGVLETLAVQPMAGRWFNAGDQDPHAAKTVMLGYGYWQRHFGADRAVIGRGLQVDSVTRTIVGVMPRGFQMVDQDFDLLVPMELDRANQRLAGFGNNGIGRLKPGVSIARADADIATLIPKWMDSWNNGPGTYPHYYDQWRIQPDFILLKQQVIGDVGRVLWVVMAMVGLVMVIACANVANLLLVRADSRQQEFSIRAALGAGRARIAREVLVESLVLGLLGGVAAVGVAYAGLRLLTAIGPAELPRLSEIALSARSLLFTLALSIFAGLLFGLLPVFKYAGPRSSLAMSGAGTGASRTTSENRAHRRSRDVLVVVQVAMALVLMVSALLMIRTFAALNSVAPGFTDARHVEILSVWIPDLLVADVHQVARLQQQIAENLAAIPGVSSAAFSATVPMDGNDANWDQITVEGKDYQNGEGPLRLYNYVAPGYFKTLGTRFVAGRDYTWDELNTLSPVLIVSESFARENWGSAAAALGKRVKRYNHSPWQQVVGVVEDVRVHGVDQEAPEIVYWPAMFYDRFDPKPQMNGLRYVSFVMRTDRAGTEGLLAQMQRAVWSINRNLPLAAANSNLPVSSVGTLQQLYALSLTRTSFTLTMLAIAGSMALALGVLGIYGVISYSVAQRTREIGVRMALGASRPALKWMFVRAALVLTAVGVAVGLGAAALLAQAMRSLLYGISPLDPLTFLAVPLILAVAGMVASYLPARRAAQVDPAQALRAE